MENVEEQRRRLAAMRDARTDDDTVRSLPSLLSNPLLNSADAAAADGKSSNFDFHADPLTGQAPLSGSTSRYGGAGILPLPPHLQPAGVYTASGSPSWQPIPNQLPSPNPGFTEPQLPSGWQPVGYQTLYVNPSFARSQPPTQLQPQFSPHHMKQWSNKASGQGRGGDRGFSGRYNGRQSPINPVGDSRRNASRGEGRGTHGRGQGGGRIVSAKEQPHLFAKKSMLEDPWQDLEVNRMERRERW